MGSNIGRNRLDALRRLLSQGTLSTQEELRARLERQGFIVTQSTVSRDLRKLRTIKTIDGRGKTTYRLSDENPSPGATSSILDLILNMSGNGSLIVIQTYPGSASLVARHLDQKKPGGILGTIAGDDTIFVALALGSQSRSVIAEIESSFRGAS